MLVTSVWTIVSVVVMLKGYKGVLVNYEKLYI